MTTRVKIVFGCAVLGCLSFLLETEAAEGEPPPKATYPSRRPVFRIDHLFISEHFKPVGINVPRNETTRLASDHLPLCAELLLDNRETLRF